MRDVEREVGPTSLELVHMQERHLRSYMVIASHITIFIAPNIFTMAFKIYVPENLTFADYIGVVQCARTWADGYDRKVVACSTQI